MIFRLLLLALACKLLLAAETAPYSLRLAGGYADHHDFGQILSSQTARHELHTGVVGIDAGYRLWQFELPFEIYIKSGFYRFLENGYQDDFFENTLYLKLYYNADFWGNRIRLGAAEGASYAWGVPMVEQVEANENSDNNSHFLNYLEVSLDFDVGRLLHVTPLRDTYLGWTLKHRSGIYGLINSVHRGGSNYNMLHIEKNF